MAVHSAKEGAEVVRLSGDADCEEHAHEGDATSVEADEQKTALLATCVHNERELKLCALIHTALKEYSIDQAATAANGTRHPATSDDNNTATSSKSLLGAVIMDLHLVLERTVGCKLLHPEKAKQLQDRAALAEEIRHLKRRQDAANQALQELEHEVVTIGHDLGAKIGKSTELTASIQSSEDDAICDCKGSLAATAAAETISRPEEIETRPVLRERLKEANEQIAELRAQISSLSLPRSGSKVEAPEPEE